MKQDQQPCGYVEVYSIPEIDFETNEGFLLRDIGSLKRAIAYSLHNTTETVAIWRLYRATQPLADRLRARGLITVLILSLLITATNAHSQQRNNWWKHASIVGSGLIAGFADGQREVIQHNKWAYRYRHPNARETWWNPDSTWRRANGDSWAGGSIFAFTKDKYHLNQAIRTTGFTIQLGFVASLTLDDFKKHGKFRFGKLLLHIAEAQVSYWLGKGAAHAYYDVF